MTNLIWKLVKGVSPLGRDERGITGLETAIVLIAFVVVSSVFAFAALSTGLFTTDKAKQTIHAGLAEVRGTMELKGSLIATAGTTGNNGTVDKLTFQISNAAGGDAIDMTVGNTIIKYQDLNQVVNLDGTGTSTFTATGIGNHDDDSLLESGEVFEVQVPGMVALLTGLPNGVALGTNQAFTLEVIPPTGAVLFIQRTTPVAMETINNLD
jgi:flagellin FlaB